MYREGHPLRRRGEPEQFIDRPLVEGVDAVPAGQHLPALVDQDVRRKPEAPAGGTGRHPGRRSRARGTRQHRPSTGANARGPALLILDEGADRWRVRQIFDDPAGDHDWGISAEVDLAASDEAGAAVLRITDVGQL